MTTLLEYIVTFNFDHTDPVTGESLSGCFVRVPAETEWAARDLVRDAYDRSWSHLYASEDKAGVVRNGLTERPLRTREQVEEAKLLRVIDGFLLEASRPLWVFRASRAQVVSGQFDPASSMGRSARTRRRKSARELADLLQKYAQEV